MPSPSPSYQFKSLAGKFTWVMFCLITSSKLSRQLFEFSLKLKVMGLNPGYLLKYFLLYLRLNEQPEIQILNGLYRLSIPLETENRVCGCSVQSFVTSLISKMTFDFLNIYWLRQLNENILIFWKVTSFSHFQIWLLWSRVRKTTS